MNSTGVAAGFFQGVLDEARVWNYARSQAQIPATKDSEIRTMPGLIGRWAMNEGAGNLLADASGAARTERSPTGLRGQRVPDDYPTPRPGRPRASPLPRATASSR